MKKILNYDSACDFHEGLAGVCRDGKWGFIDTSGREVVPCKYDAVNDFHEGLALVKLDGKFGYIDKTGCEVIPLQYGWAGDFHEGLAKLGGQCFIDKAGQKALDLAELGIVFSSSFSNGLAVALCEPGGKRGYIDKTGELVIPCKYDEAHDFQTDLQWSEKDVPGDSLIKPGRWSLNIKPSPLLLPRSLMPQMMNSRSKR